MKSKKIKISDEPNQRPTEPASFLAEPKQKSHCHKINELLSASSLSFVLRVSQTKNVFLKLAWITFLLGSNGICIYYLVLNVLGYFAFNANSSIDKIQQGRPEFPAIR